MMGSHNVFLPVKFCSGSMFIFFPPLRSHQCSSEWFDNWAMSIANILNLQTVLFRPLRSHQCSSEWFENWDMSIAQRAINTSHTGKQWHILFLNTRDRVLKLKRASNA